MASVLTVAVVFATVLLVGSRPAAALLPRPLPVTSSAITVEDLIRDTAVPPALSVRPVSQPGYQLEGWYNQIEYGRPEQQFIQPQRVETATSPDGSATTTLYAGVPLASKQMEGTPAPQEALEPGSIISRETWSPGEFLSQFPTPPPEDVNGMRAYLDEYLFAQGVAGSFTPNSGDYVVAVVSLMQTWTLSDAAQRAALGVIVRAPGTKIAGSTIDRAGRVGLLLRMPFGAIGSPDVEEQLVIDPGSGRIFDEEVTSVAGIPGHDIPPGSVISYTIWR